MNTPTILVPSAARAVRLDKNDPDVLRIRLLKVGTFNGSVKITKRDLADLAARFAELHTGNVFTPPLRVDHSYSVTSVVGHLDAVSIADAPDPSQGGRVVPWLWTAARLAGSAEARREIREDVTSGRLVHVSAELMPYETNAGKKYPRVLAGAALVDIPAVEGARVVLSRQGARGGDLAHHLPLSLPAAEFGRRWAALTYEQRSSDEGRAAYELWRLNHERRTRKTTR